MDTDTVSVESKTLDEALADIQAKASKEYNQRLQMEDVDVEVKDNDKSYHPSGDESDEDEDEDEEDEEGAAAHPAVVQLDNSLDDFIVPDKQKNGPSWLDFLWADQCHFLVEYLSDGKMPHKDKWDMSKHNKYDFKWRAKKFYLDMNGQLYTKVSHKDSISKVTASKYIWIYVVMFFECVWDLQSTSKHPNTFKVKLCSKNNCTSNAFGCFEVLWST